MEIKITSKKTAVETAKSLTRAPRNLQFKPSEADEQIWKGRSKTGNDGAWRKGNILLIMVSLVATWHIIPADKPQVEDKPKSFATMTQEERAAVIAENNRKLAEINEFRKKERATRQEKINEMKKNNSKPVAPKAQLKPANRSAFPVNVHGTYNDTASGWTEDQEDGITPPPVDFRNYKSDKELFVGKHGEAMYQWNQLCKSALITATHHNITMSAHEAFLKVLGIEIDL